MKLVLLILSILSFAPAQAHAVFGWLTGNKPGFVDESDFGKQVKEQPGGLGSFSCEESTKRDYAKLGKIKCYKYRPHPWDNQAAVTAISADGAAVYIHRDNRGLDPLPRVTKFIGEGVGKPDHLTVLETVKWMDGEYKVVKAIWLWSGNSAYVDAKCPAAHDSQGKLIYPKFSDCFALQSFIIKRVNDLPEKLKGFNYEY